MIYMWCNISEKEQHFRWLRETMKWEQRGKFFEIARAFLRNTTCKITCKSCLGLKRNCSFFFLFYGSLLFVNECFRATEQLPGTRGRTIRNSMVFLRAIRVINDGTWRWWAVFDEINSTLVSGIEQLVRIYRNDWTIESKEKKKKKKNERNVSADDRFRRDSASFLTSTRLCHFLIARNSSRFVRRTIVLETEHRTFVSSIVCTRRKILFRRSFRFETELCSVRRKKFDSCRSKTAWERLNLILIHRATGRKEATWNRTFRFLN